MRTINDAKIPIFCWADGLEDEALKQAINVANHPMAFHHVVLCADAHSGYGFPIGCVAAFEDVVSAYAVGNDIACSMLASRLDGISQSDIIDMSLRKTIHDSIKREVPTGVRHNSDWKTQMEYDHADKLMSKHGIDNDIISREAVADQLGTLGAGNHFWELQISESEGLTTIWIMIHCGSRNIGSKVCTKYFKLSKDYCDQKGYSLPDPHLSFLPMDHVHGIDYWKQMQFCMDFSHENKEVILERTLQVLRKTFKNVSVAEKVLIHHNFASVETHFGKQVVVHRKGATPAFKGTIGIIPGSMGTGSFIVEGMGNADSFESCSHGAGRAMSRQKARDSISLSAIKRQMEGIYFDACKNIIEEAPDAYKDISVVMNAQTEGDSPLVKIVHSMRPLINIKDTSDSNPKNRTKNKDRTCPNGHVFGTDFDKFKECKLQFCDEKDRNSCRHRMTVLKNTEICQ